MTAVGIMGYFTQDLLNFNFSFPFNIDQCKYKTPIQISFICLQQIFHVDILICLYLALIKEYVFSLKCR